MKKNLLLTLYTIFLSFSFVFFSCTEADFNGSIKDDFENDYYTTYTFCSCNFDNPDLDFEYVIECTTKEISYRLGTNVDLKTLPRFDNKEDEHINTLWVKNMMPGFYLSSWRYYKNYSTQDTTVPSNFTVDEDNNVSSFTVYSSPVYLYAVWEIRNDMPYSVRHYIETDSQNEDGNTEFSLYKEENFTGTTFEKTQAAALEIEDYKAEPFSQTSISKYGITVVPIYYIRDKSSQTKTEITVLQALEDENLGATYTIDSDSKIITFSCSKTDCSQYLWFIDGILKDYTESTIYENYSAWSHGSHIISVVGIEGDFQYSQVFTIFIERTDL